MIGQALPKAVGYGHDLAAREHAAGFLYGGMAFPARVWVFMRWRITRRRCIFHGQGNAMLLPTVMRFNRMVCRAAFQPDRPCADR